MPIRNRIVALCVSIGMLFLIIELVRRRKLREEYSWLWLLTVSTILLLTVWFDLLKWITFLIGAILPSSTIFMLAFLFLIFIREKANAQHVAISCEWARRVSSQASEF